VTAASLLLVLFLTAAFTTESHETVRHADTMERFRVEGTRVVKLSSTATAPGLGISSRLASNRIFVPDAPSPIIPATADKEGLALRTVTTSDGDRQPYFEQLSISAVIC
jgi:hypothetical protein